MLQEEHLHVNAEHSYTAASRTADRVTVSAMLGCHNHWCQVTALSELNRTANWPPDMLQQTSITQLGSVTMTT